MNYLSMLNDDEIKYICSVIPIQDSRWYFKNNPNDFAKVMPGFRPTSLRNQEQVSSLLFRYRNHHFISSFLEKHISRWIVEIQEEIRIKIDKGESKESAWIQTLPYCYFVDYISIFFKLIGDDLHTQDISLISSSIKKIKDLESLQKSLEEELYTKKLEVMRLEDDTKRIQFELKKTIKKLFERSSEIEALKQSYIDLSKLEDVVRSRNQEIDDLKNKAQKNDEYVQKLKDELSVVKDSQQQLKIKEEIKKQQEVILIENAVSLKPRCPSDIDEFRDYLGYNLESLGVDAGAEYYSLLKEYLCKILFKGKPIIISRIAGVTLMRCVANTLVGSKNVTTLSFTLDISDQQIDLFLSSESRILCLDNFVGNYNETTLFTICDKHRDKIIFLTTAYDRTLLYIPEEILKYCNYLNLNRIEAFNHDRALSEEPSTIEEGYASEQSITPDAHWSPLLKEMLDDFGISSVLSTYKSSLISDEVSLCCVLAFDALPFCMDVIGISPFNISKRLNKYAGDKGRCPNKELFRRWFV